MRTRWLGDLPDDQPLDPSLRQLVGGIAKVLDRLRPPAVASGSVFVVPDVPAVVVPHARIPGCSLVLQVSDWSSSVGCWWSERTDPRQGPPTLELFAEFPLQPDGITRAVAWFAQELRRPLVEQVRRYGIVCRRDWLVVLDDDYQLSLWRQWLPWWQRPRWARKAVEERAAGWLAAPARPEEEEEEEEEDDDDDDAAVEGVSLPGDRWLLGAAATAAAAAWILAVSWPELAGAAWVPLTVRVLRVAALAMLFTWFGVATLDHPPRLRVPMLAGLGLSMLRLGLGFLAGSAALPSGTESALRTLGMFLRGWWPDLLGVAALACYLVAFLGMSRREPLRRWWPRVLPVAVLVSLADLAVGLRWLVPVVPASGAKPTLPLLVVLVVAGRAVAVGIAIASLLVVLDRRAGMVAGAVRAGVAGEALLAVAWGNMVETGLGRLAVLLRPALLVRAILSAPFGLALFAGTALVAFAAAQAPAVPSQQGRTASSVRLPRAPTRSQRT
jgi:hypothetical protein